MDLAKQIEKHFNEPASTFFALGCTVNKIRIPTTGKFMRRLNYLRTLLQEIGALVIPKKAVPLAADQTNITGNDMKFRSLVYSIKIHEMFRNVMHKKTRFYLNNEAHINLNEHRFLEKLTELIIIHCSYNIILFVHYIFHLRMHY